MSTPTEQAASAPTGTHHASRMMTDFAARLAEVGAAVTCSPGSSANNVYVLVEFADGTLGRWIGDPSGRDPIGPQGVVNYDHHGDAHRERMLAALLSDIRRLGGATLNGILAKPYQQFWQGHHEVAAALTRWWESRMGEGHTIESASILLGLTAHPDTLSRVRIVDDGGRSCAWLDHYPAGHPNAHFEASPTPGNPYRGIVWPSAFTAH